MNLLKVKTTSSEVMGLPSWARALGLMSKMIHEKSAGIFHLLGDEAVVDLDLVLRRRHEGIEEIALAAPPPKRPGRRSD